MSPFTLVSFFCPPKVRSLGDAGVIVARDLPRRVAVSGPPFRLIFFMSAMPFAMNSEIPMVLA